MVLALLVHFPCIPLKSPIPAAVEMPAPVKNPTALVKQSLNSDTVSQQFNQYQPNELPHLTQTIKHRNNTAYGIGNPDAGLVQTQTCVVVEPVNEISVAYVWKEHMIFFYQSIVVTIHKFDMRIV